MKNVERMLPVLLVLSGCGASQKPEPKTPASAEAPPELPEPTADAQAPAPAAPRTPIAVKLEVEAMTRKGQRVLASGEKLRTGDRMALSVAVDQPAYLYVAHAAADGTTTVLFPHGGGDQQVRPDSATRIPPAGQWFRLDKNIGREDLFVYAAHEPLAGEELAARIKRDASKAKAMAKNRKKRPRPHEPGPSGTTWDAAPPPTESDAPGGLTAGTRGLELADDAEQTQSGVTSVQLHHPAWAIGNDHCSTRAPGVQLVGNPARAAARSLYRVARLRFADAGGETSVGMIVGITPAGV